MSHASLPSGGFQPADVFTRSDNQKKCRIENGKGGKELKSGKKEAEKTRITGEDEVEEERRRNMTAINPKENRIKVKRELKSRRTRN